MIKYNMPDVEYHSRPEIGSTSAKLMLDSPLLYQDRVSGIVPFADRPVFAIGRAAHAMVLEPDRFDDLYTSKGPVNPKTGKPYGRETQAFADWQAANPEITVVEPWLYLALERMPHEVAELLTAGLSEVSIFCDLPALGIGIKARPDHLAGDRIVDLKTIDSIDNCERAISRYRYWFSHAWYRMTAKQERGYDHSMIFVFMEKASPHRWRIYDLAQNYIDYADAKVDEILGEISHRTETGNWEDPAPIRHTAEIPRWLDPETFTMTEEGISL